MLELSKRLKALATTLMAKKLSVKDWTEFQKNMKEVGVVNLKMEIKWFSLGQLEALKKP